MQTAFLPRTLVLFFGDLIFFIASLWVSLFVRSWTIPSRELLEAYAVPFAWLFFIWMVVYFVAGLYESRSIVLTRRTLSRTLLVAQSVNVVFAALFFFFIPFFGVTPKTILIIYLPISFVLVLAWRAFLFPWLRLQGRETAVVVGEGPDIDALVSVLDVPHSSVNIEAVVLPSEGALSKTIAFAVELHHPKFIVADFSDPRVAAAFPHLYSLLSQGIRFLDAEAVYEEVFGRVALGQIDESWLARNVSAYAHPLYDSLKGIMDFLGGVIFGLISLVLFPFIMAAIYIETGRPLFIAQDRIGQNNRLVRIYKFRSMSGNDNGEYGKSGTSSLKVTKVGAFLRTWRFDELPQLWNVVRGDISLIGPRLELPSLVAKYEESIPYYSMRHLIKPGLSGWAQLYHHADPHHTTDVDGTKMKLSYDLYYLKHRSLALDLIIALKTVRRLLIRGNA